MLASTSTEGELRDAQLSTDKETVARTFMVPSSPFDEVLCDSKAHLLKTFDLSDNFLSEAQYREFTNLAVALSQDLRLVDIISRELDLTRPDAAGYLVLDFSNVVADRLTIRDYIILTAVCTIFGRPFGAFRKYGLWKPIGVDPEVDPWRAGGTGLNPLHIDFVNATLPPDYTCFFCIREDPLGGGQSVISSHLKVFSMLTPKQRELALAPAIHEGKFFDLLGIGTELQPFPLFECGNDGSITCRFTAKSLFVDGGTEKIYVDLIREISDLLDQHSVAFQLRSKQLLIVHQGIACHGRLPLETGQAGLVPERRRMLSQIFIRK